MADHVHDTPFVAGAGAATRLARQRGVWRNLLQFLLKRAALLSLSVISAVFLIIVIANLGGHVDTIVAARIRESVGFTMMQGWLSELPPDERMVVAEETIAAMQDAAGLNDPFLLRTLGWLGDGLTLDWGSGRTYGHATPGATVGTVILDNLSRSLLVFGLATLLMFGTSVWLALFTSRHRGGRLDRLFILLAPISSAPAWVYGVLLSVLFLRVFGFSTGGTFDRWEGGLRLTQIVVILRHLLLPFLAIFLAGLFQTVYVWRSFFQVYSDEDYVEMAHAKGLSASRINRNYIVRPALPALLTQFALLPAILWQELIALEYFFNVEGLGRLFVSALRAFDTPMIVATVTVFAYLVALTVLILDVAYVLVDPRIRAGKQANAGKRAGAAQGRRKWRRGKQATTRKRVQERADRDRLRWSLPRPDLLSLVTSLREMVRRLGQTVLALRRYPSAIFGLTVIGLLIAVSVYTMIAMPYEDTVSRWRGEDNVWSRNPRAALPAWVNLFRRDDLPPTLAFDSTNAESGKTVSELEGGLTNITIPMSFTYDYGGYPQEIVVDLTAPYAERGPHVTLTWIWPDGSERELTGFKPNQHDSYFVSRDTRLERRLKSEHPLEALFQDPEAPGGKPIKGVYQLRIDALLFEPDTDVDAEVTILGQVYGLAGTDSQRRDLIIPLLWGTPVALAFGLIAAIATSAGSMLLAAIGAWYGGVVDRVVQFLTEVSLILPFFPVSLMVFTMYSRSIIAILGVVVVLTMFGSATKTYRATFLQIRSEPYVEAARAYGASNWRIVVRYLVPRIMPVLIPQLIILVPSYVFLEATLAFLGVSDPLLPTWGKLVVAALGSGIHMGATHVVLLPFGVLFLTGFAFAMVGLALEQVLAPMRRG